MNAELWAEIRRLYKIERRRVTDIARRLHVDRKTVRKALASERVPVVVRVRKQPTFLSPYTGFIQERLKAYPHLPATVLFQDLQKHPGLTDERQDRWSHQYYSQIEHAERPFPAQIY